MRREFSSKIRVEAFRRCQGLCEACGANLSAGKFAYDHVVPDQLGGEPTLRNCAVLCNGCHVVKTAIDVGRISKAKRQERSHIGAKVSASPMPFGRKSKFKKRMDGSIVLRGPLN